MVRLLSLAFAAQACAIVILGAAVWRRSNAVALLTDLCNRLSQRVDALENAEEKKAPPLRLGIFESGEHR